MTFNKPLKPLILLIAIEGLAFQLIGPANAESFISKCILVCFGLGIVLNQDLVGFFARGNFASDMQSKRAYNKVQSMVDKSYHYHEDKENNKNLSKLFFMMGGLNGLAFLGLYYM